MGGYKELRVWKDAYELTLDIYEITKGFPEDERYGLISQMRRAVVSIPANIAEGYSRNHQKEYIQFVTISLGSCNELGVYLLLSKDLGFISDCAFDELNDKNIGIGQMLSSLRNSLKKNIQNQFHRNAIIPSKICYTLSASFCPSLDASLSNTLPSPSRNTLSASFCSSLDASISNTLSSPSRNTLDANVIHTQFSA
jgi:four helix bundle protein